MTAVIRNAAPPTTTRRPGPPPADAAGHRSGLSRLLDPKSMMPIHPLDGSGVLAVRGLIQGRPVYAFSTDAGRLGTAGCRHIVGAIDAAVLDEVPVIGLWHTGMHLLDEGGVDAMDAIGRIYTAITHASGSVPQLSIVLGPTVGAAAYCPPLTDVVIMSEDGRLCVTGPDLVRAVTGEEIDLTGLGGPATHDRKTGAAHVVARGDDEAFDQARRITDLLARPGRFDAGNVEETGDLAAVLPDDIRRAYDVRPLLHRLLDPRPGGPPLDELHSRWAPNVVVGLGRLAGRTVGVVANNPLRKGGCLDSLAADKASRFVSMCDSLGVPLVVVVDLPGYLPGLSQEWGGVVRRGAKLLYAFADAAVPRVTLVTRKAYGGGYIAMNSRSLGATAVFAWPDAEVAVMGAEAAVGILHRKRLAAVTGAEQEALREQLVAEQIRNAGGLGKATEIGVVDEVVEPADTRRRIARAFAEAPAARGYHKNPPQ